MFTKAWAIRQERQVWIPSHSDATHVIRIYGTPVNALRYVYSEVWSVAIQSASFIEKIGCRLGAIEHNDVASERFEMNDIA